MDYLLLRIIQQYYMKTMLHVLRKSNENILKVLHVLRKSNEDISKVIELSTFRKSYSTLVNFKKMVKLMRNK